jgi:hypothetical protein
LDGKRQREATVTIMSDVTADQYPRLDCVSKPKHIEQLIATLAFP